MSGRAGARRFSAPKDWHALEIRSLGPSGGACRNTLSVSEDGRIDTLDELAQLEPACGYTPDELAAVDPQRWSIFVISVESQTTTLVWAAQRDGVARLGYYESPWCMGMPPPGPGPVVLVVPGHIRELQLEHRCDDDCGPGWKPV